jgi:hypothetical protein
VDTAREKKTFTYEEALGKIPAVRSLTEAAVFELEALLGSEPDTESIPPEMVAEYQRILASWAASMVELGAEVKGLWLVDFDSGDGYYCWRYPEPSLQFFHGYEEGFGGRVELN